MKTELRLLLLAVVLATTALLSAAPPAAALCFRYCWHVDADTACCQTRTCEIVCG